MCVRVGRGRGGGGGRSIDHSDARGTSVDNRYRAEILYSIMNRVLRCEGVRSVGGGEVATVVTILGIRFARPTRADGYRRVTDTPR